MWTKYSSAPCTESPETIQIVSGTVLERLFYRALDAKGNIIFCIKSSLILNKYLEFSLECACCMRHVYTCIYIHTHLRCIYIICTAEIAGDTYSAHFFKIYGWSIFEG